MTGLEPPRCRRPQGRGTRRCMSSPGREPQAREGQRLGLRPERATGLGLGSYRKDEDLSQG